jgi:hypothetical protein
VYEIFVGLAQLSRSLFILLLLANFVAYFPFHLMMILSRLASNRGLDYPGLDRAGKEQYFIDLRREFEAKYSKTVLGRAHLRIMNGFLIAGIAVGAIVMATIWV